MVTRHLHEAEPVCDLEKLRGVGTRMGEWEEGNSLMTTDRHRAGQWAEWLGGEVTGWGCPGVPLRMVWP